MLELLDTTQAWRRLCLRILVTGSVASLVLALLAGAWEPTWYSLAPRVYLPSYAALIAYYAAERWPAQLSSWCGRWVIQVVAVTLVIPGVVFAFYFSGTPSGGHSFWEVPERFNGFLILCSLGTLTGSWTAMSALLRQRDATIRAAERARGENERQALDVRFRLLQAQVEPHFLFNTLANVQGLVQAGSPRASEMLGNLISYLRAAVPRLSEPAYRMGQELDMVRSYLTLMQFRMPDRLSFTIHANVEIELFRCPPMIMMTLVENSVRHGIDPSVDGGSIELRIELRDGDTCLITVLDTGVGLQSNGNSLGTGLSSLRERLQMAFPGRGLLRIAETVPRGVRAEVEFPAKI